MGWAFFPLLLFEIEVEVVFEGASDGVEVDFLVSYFRQTMVDEVLTVDRVLIFVLLDVIQIVQFILLHFPLEDAKIANEVFHYFLFIVYLLVEPNVGFHQQLDNVADVPYSPDTMVDTRPRYGWYFGFCYAFSLDWLVNEEVAIVAVKLVSEVEELNIFFSQMMELLNDPGILCWNFVYQLDFL